MCRVFVHGVCRVLVHGVCGVFVHGVCGVLVHGVCSVVMHPLCVKSIAFGELVSPQLPHMLAHATPEIEAL